MPAAACQSIAREARSRGFGSWFRAGCPAQKLAGGSVGRSMSLQATHAKRRTSPGCPVRKLYAACVLPPGRRLEPRTAPACSTAAHRTLRRVRSAKKDGLLMAVGSGRALATAPVYSTPAHNTLRRVGAAIGFMRWAPERSTRHGVVTDSRHLASTSTPGSRVLLCHRGVSAVSRVADLDGGRCPTSQRQAIRRKSHQLLTWRPVASARKVPESCPRRVISIFHHAGFHRMGVVHAHVDGWDFRYRFVRARRTCAATRIGAEEHRRQSLVDRSAGTVSHPWAYLVCRAPWPDRPACHRAHR